MRSDKIRAAIPAMRLMAVAGLGIAVVLGATRVEEPVTIEALGTPVAGNPVPQLPILEPTRWASLTCVGPEAQGLADPTVEEVPMPVEVGAARAPQDVLAEVADLDRQAGVLRLDPIPAIADESVSPVVTSDPEQPALISITEAQGMQVSAEGTAAAGLVATQWHRGEAEFARGLTVAPCLPAATESWLIAGGGDTGRLERLVLMNPSTDPITVDVTVHGVSGVLPSTGGSGVVVPGEGRVVMLVDAIAAGEASPALHLRSSGGPVVAALGDRWLEGSIDRGLELSVPAAAPDLRQIVPVVSSDAVTDLMMQQLRVVVPGDVEAIVQVRALTPEGPVRVANDVTRIGAGAVADIDISDLPEGASAVEVTSDVSITAASVAQVRTPVADPALEDPETDPADEDGEPADVDPAELEPAEEVSELIWLPAASGISTLSGAVLPQDAEEPLTSSVLLASVDGAQVELTTIEAAGEPSTQQVEMPAAGSVRVDVGQAQQVWIRPVSGEVHGAVVISAPDAAGGAMVAGLPLAETPVSREVLPVAPALP